MCAVIDSNLPSSSQNEVSWTLEARVRPSGKGASQRSLKDTDILLSRAEKLRRDARSVRGEAVRLSLACDRQRLMDVANRFEVEARDLEGRARRVRGR